MNKNILKYVIITVISICCALLVFFGIVIFNEKNKYNFKGQSSQGEVTLNSFKGQNIVIYFGYTYCPDVCPLTIEALNNAVNSLKEYNISQKDILLLYATLDPDRDTTTALDEYSLWFYPNAMGIRFEHDELKRVANNYNIKYQKFKMEGSAMDYSVAHSSALFFFNKKGELVQTITNLTEENIANAIKATVGIK